MMIKGYEEYIDKKFNIATINQEIEDNLEKYYEKNKPKHST